MSSTPMPSLRPTVDIEVKMISWFDISKAEWESIGEMIEEEEDGFELTVIGLCYSRIMKAKTKECTLPNEASTRHRLLFNGQNFNRN